MTASTFTLSIFLLMSILIQYGKAQNFRFASYYASTMVLQKGPQRAVIWGHAPTSAVNGVVTVSVDGVSSGTGTVISGPIADNATWSVTLTSGMPAGGPHLIAATLDGATIELTEVLFGDVYICSGQSNMAHTLSNTDTADFEVSDVVNYPNIRIFTTSLTTSDVPLHEPLRIDQPWLVPNAQNTGQFSAVCWLFAKSLYNRLQYPIGLIESAWGGTGIQAWSSPAALSECYDGPAPPGSQPQHQPSALWNAMIHPFRNLTIYGALWYQGEHNANEADLYACMQPAMIDDWRRQFNVGSSGQTSLLFPFGFVQLAPNANSPNSLSFTAIRWTQTNYFGYTPNIELPGVFMAVAVDLPDFDSPHGSIHPRYKRQIAHRLYLGALSVAYGLTDGGRFQGPFPTNLQRVGDVVTVDFDNGDTELTLKTVTGIELCCSTDAGAECSDNNWQYTNIITNSLSQVSVAVPCASQFVVGIRYIWRESPCALEACAIYSVENDLPVPPFIFKQLIE